MPVDTPTKILNCAAEAFNQNGVEATSVAAIAEKAGISPGNITYHFAKKRDIILALEERFQRDIIDLHDNTARAIADGRIIVTASETHKLLKQTFDLAWSNRFYATSFSALSKIDQEVLERFNRLERNARLSLAVLVQHGIDKRVIIQPSHPCSVQKIADTIWYMLWGRIMIALIDREGFLSVSHVRRDCLEGFISIIAPHIAADFALDLAALAAAE